MVEDVSFTPMKIGRAAFNDMIQRYEEFRRRNGRKPAKIYLDRGRTQYVVLERFEEMRDRWDDFITVNRREPNYINMIPPYDGCLGIWLNFADLDRANPGRLRMRGFTEVILSSKSLEQPDGVRTFIEDAKAHRVRVHAWIQALKKGDEWYKPEDKENLERVQGEVEKALEIGFKAIHFDYVRYPGTANKYKNAADKIIEFIKEAKKPTKSKKVVFSAAVMPEMEANAEYYGQDYAKMAKELDVLIPMAYKGNYKQTSDWIRKVTEYVKKKAKASVWTGIQGYKSDENPQSLSRAETITDIEYAARGGAEKVIIFRLGLTSLI